jgi:hypothetical protein
MIGDLAFLFVRRRYASSRSLQPPQYISNTPISIKKMETKGSLRGHYTIVVVKDQIFELKKLRPDHSVRQSHIPEEQRSQLHAHEKP